MCDGPTWWGLGWSRWDWTRRACERCGAASGVLCTVWLAAELLQRSSRPVPTHQSAICVIAAHLDTSSSDHFTR